MNELIKVNYERENPTVAGRDLHEFLEIGTEYMKWFERMTEYGFTENIDFSSILTESTGGRPSTNHALTIAMAKEICMLQRNEKGKQARLYFIEVERKYKESVSPFKIPQSFAEALRLAAEQAEKIEAQTKVIAELKPKADYTDRILQCKGTVKVSAISKDYGMSAVEFNKMLHDFKIQYKQGDIWLLYEKYQSCGYTHSKTFDYEDKSGMPQARIQTQWTQQGRLFLYEFLKYHGILPLIERSAIGA